MDTGENMAWYMKSAWNTKLVDDLMQKRRNSSALAWVSFVLIHRNVIANITRSYLIVSVWCIYGMHWMQFLIHLCLLYLLFPFASSFPRGISKLSLQHPPTCIMHYRAHREHFETASRSTKFTVSWYQVVSCSYKFSNKCWINGHYKASWEPLNQHAAS